MIIERKGKEFVARCPEVAGAVARANTKEDAIEKIRAVIIEKFGSDDDSDDGIAPKPHPVSPPPRSPIAAREELHEKPDA